MFIYFDSKGHKIIVDTDQTNIEEKRIRESFFPLIGIYSNKLWYPLNKNLSSHLSIFSRKLDNKEENEQIAKSKLDLIIKNKNYNNFSKKEKIKKFGNTCLKN